MTNHKITPSDRVSSSLPSYIYENYERFVDFMSTAAQSEERVGFGQDILQNLQKYRDFDTYKKEIVQFGSLKTSLAEDATDELELVSGYGFPENNGVILIDDEVILYQTKEDNFFYGLQRGAAGTTVLPTLRSSGTYVKTVAATHNANTQVTNLSVLFLVGMLSNIHDSFAPNISADRIDPAINRSSLLQNIKDFFASKGSKLGVKALFRMLFSENDVEVNYPGDRMMSPSDSAWTEKLVMRVVPLPESMSDHTKTYATPDKAISAYANFINDVDGSIVGSTVIDYAIGYPRNDDVQYELYVDEDNVTGSIPVNPTSTLTRQLDYIGEGNDLTDVFTVTVESTIGFPDSGIIYIESEAIKYTSKTFNQFVGCTRGFYGTNVIHAEGERVYGPYRMDARWTIDGVEYVSLAWPLSLAHDVQIDDPGLLHTTDDEVIADGPGVLDSREPSLRTFIQNTNYELTDQFTTLPNMASVLDRVHGVSGVFLDEDNVYVSSANLPGYQIGPYSTDNTVGPGLQGENALHVIPRYENRTENTNGIVKGTDSIGVFVDGLPAYSNVSDNKVYSGKLTSITIDNQGGNYENPTILVNDTIGVATATIKNGKIATIDFATTQNYTTVPTVRITSGEGATVSLTFDNYGRVATAAVTGGGSYYNDAPSISIIDASGRGRGALLACDVSGGAITGVSISTHGIDYNPATTTAVINPIGSGAEFTAEIEYYQFDRVYEINNNPNWVFDSGNAFLMLDSENARTKLGYLGNPIELRQYLSDEGGSHSPIIGWAYDGNPIYGPYGFANGVDSTDGVERQFSGWVLQEDRTGIIPASGTTAGSLPPSTTTYPMGTFVEDYKFQPEIVIGGVGRILTEPYIQNSQVSTELSIGLTTENDTEILLESSETTQSTEIQLEDGQTLESESLGAMFSEPVGVAATYQITDENGDYINHQTAAPAVLDSLNGKVCNTPEFPVELYPEGVYCYFVSTYGERITYPYIIGPKFKNRPISQRISVIDDTGSVTQPTNDQSSFDDTELTFDFREVGRYRNLALTQTQQDVEVEISDVTTGSISGVRVESGLPATTMVGDLCYFGDSDLGSGAAARVSHVSGKDIVKASGTKVATKLISHHQRINLSSIDGSFVFVEGSTIDTSGGAIAEVVSYDFETKYLDVQVTTKQLINFGDTFRDNRDVLITIPGSYSGALINSQMGGGSSTFVSYGEPSDDLTPGDLWWNANNGRLYIYFQDADSSQWVTANPSGSRPLFGASDEALSYEGELSQEFSSAQAENRVTIAEMAPSARTDGGANQAGDMWWSSTTGLLYIWNEDKIVDYEQGAIPFSGEWIATDPVAAKNTNEGLGVESQFETLPTAPGVTYSGDVTVLMSETAPLILPNGDPLAPGTLWWSPISGRLYIFYTDVNNSQWVATNVGSNSTQYSLSTIISNDGGSIPEAVSILEETGKQRSLWAESLNHFIEGDSIEFIIGAPGTDHLNDTATITNRTSSSNMLVNRGGSDTPKTLRNGTVIENKSRSIYRITTTEAHGLLAGDTIRIEDSEFPEINGDHAIIEVGNVEPAEGFATIAGGVVTGVTITSPGAKYRNNFYVNFYGGGGVGAYAYAEVNTYEQGGNVTNVTMVSTGHNYTEAPTVVFGEFETNHDMLFYVDTEYGEDTNMKYSTTSTLIQAEATYVEVTSPGQGFTALPEIKGTYKRDLGDAETHIEMDGSTIESIEVIRGGSRYTNPAVIIVDTTNNGSGAEAVATVADGIVTGITVTNPGTNYIEPVVRLVEQDGKYIALTNDIGKIKALRITGSGTQITSDSTIAPFLNVQSRLVVSPTETSTGTFVAGEFIYQGTSSLNLVTAEVVSYDDAKQILLLENIVGTIKENEYIRNSFGTEARVVLEGQPSLELNVAGTSGVEGKFIDDSSKLSSTYAVIQDSEYFQRFSYEISSPLQQVQYDTFVRDIVHPTGFAMFSNVIVNSSISAPSVSEEVTLTIESGDTAPILVIGLDGVDYTNDITGLSGYTAISGLALEDQEVI